jgi:two-component system sensor histidine kinase KdpD
LSRISATIRETLGVTECRLHTAAAFQDGVAEDLAAWVARHGRAAMRLDDGTTRLSDSADPLVGGREVRALFLPLRVRGGTVGVLEIADALPFSLDAAQRRFLTALSYYAALAIERVRLSTEADHVEALREADRLKDALLASVSHDLRTPLTTIKAHAHALASLGDDRAMAIEEEADRLGRLVADLLELSRLQAGALPVVLELNAVDDLIGAALQRASGALQGHEVRVAMENGGTLLVGRFDFVHTLRILVNLLENAAKYAAPRTPIDLTVRRMGEVLAIAVADRGHGIPESEQTRIFEPFYRPPGAAPDVAGVGLGLSIARRLAEAQDGSLEHSPREGGGSVFTLRLRAADLPQPAHSELEGEL